LTVSVCPKFNLRINHLVGCLQTNICQSATPTAPSSLVYPEPAPSGRVMSTLGAPSCKRSSAGSLNDRAGWMGEGDTFKPRCKANTQVGGMREATASSATGASALPERGALLAMGDVGHLDCKALQIKGWACYQQAGCRTTNNQCGVQP